jgi:CPA2 family monovalent cation:H+ antiporter-2
VVLNAAPGVVAGLVLGWGPVAAVVLGGVTYVTSSGISAKVLGDLGWLGHRETPVVLSLLVLEDLAMIVYLPILAALLIGTGPVDATITLGVAAVAVTVALIISLRFGHRVEAFLHSPSEEVFLLKVFGTTLWPEHDLG